MVVFGITKKGRVLVLGRNKRSRSLDAVVSLIQSKNFCFRSHSSVAIVLSLSRFVGLYSRFNLSVNIIYKD